MSAVIKGERLVADLGPHDFADLVAHLSKTRGAYALFGDITRLRTLFKFGDENYHVKPHYGSAFNKPSKAELRRAREAKGPRMFTAKQIRKMLAAASVPLRAMIYLGINCGFGNEDCATLPLDRIDLDKGCHTYGRKKTGVSRRCPLWPETVAAVRAALAERPKPRSAKEAKLVFLTHQGRSWSQTERHDNVISKELAKITKDLGFHRPGLSFYALRHTFQTIAEESGDATATSFIMGHVPRSEDMAAVYRERMNRKRLVRTVKYVRRWLFKKGKKRHAPHEGSSRSSQECPAAPVSGGEPAGERAAPTGPA
jgi:integrase